MKIYWWINTCRIKDDYVFEFIGLPDSHNESDLQKGLLNDMKKFILELGKDFLFVGEEYRVQVGNSDFYIDLLFFHSDLQCLVAFELLCCAQHKRSRILIRTGCKYTFAWEKEKKTDM
jgi:predicted nuclease of restriction endonuclease-like (RecB) superfamily